MDYKGHVCPVCNKTFIKGDDVVVCPICGTPHHRDCYEAEGTCFNQKRHREKYDYRRECEVNSVEDEGVICPFCKGQNPADSRFCNSCGKPIAPQQNAEYSSGSQYSTNETPQGNFGGAFVMDPLGGVSADEKVSDSVTAGEAAKFVKTGTPFYIPQFKQMHEHNRTRFSFVGFIFGGGWMLYRKMYKLGSFFTVLWGLILLAQTYISLFYVNFLNSTIETYYELMNQAISNMNGMADVYSQLFSNMTTEQLVVFISYFALALLTLLMRVVCGIFGNRWYYKHSIKTISKIKSSHNSPTEVDATLSARGGVNVPLAISLIASYYILMYLPLFI